MKQVTTERDRINAIRLRRIAVFLLENEVIDRDYWASQIQDIALSVDPEYWTRTETPAETERIENLA